MRRVRLNSSVRGLLLTALSLGLAASYLGASASAFRAGQAPGGVQRTVWDGVFTAGQADRGRGLFSNHCAECHGENLEGGEGKPLVGDKFWAAWGDSTVAELLTYISTNMPFSDDGSLKGTLPKSTYVDVLTHILKMNGFPDGTRELTPESGVGVQIVKKDGPGELPASVNALVVGCLEPREADGTWRLVKGTRPRRASSPSTISDRDVLSNLTRLVGHRVAVTGLLLGTGGINGLNVSSVQSVADTCN
jgi:cytochrome c5